MTDYFNIINPDFLYPPWLKPGDLVCVVATSGALRERAALEKGLEVWRERGYHISFSEHWDKQEGYLAGTDEQRREALAQAWQNPDCRAILCARGGYGSARLLENWQWTPRTPPWVIGFSDVTGILWSLAKQGISSLHAPVLTTLAAEPTWSQARLFDWLEGGLISPLTGKPWVNGVACGRLIVGNLTVATHILQTRLQPNLEGVILALEDVGEAPYRLDRLLTQWRLLGLLDSVRGIALGRFSRCAAPEGIPSWSVEAVLRDRLGDLGIPILADLPFGHDGVNAALPLGIEVELDATQGVLGFFPTNGKVNQISVPSLG
jgi:muramoyltetrapeptide carboxypeptidase